MKIVIDIPKHVYEHAKEQSEDGYDEWDAMRAIANGTPLPEHHGKLKDADAMIKKLCTHEASELFGSVTCAEIMDFISDEKPIIEAEGSESE